MNHDSWNFSIYIEKNFQFPFPFFLLLIESFKSDKKKCNFVLNIELINKIYYWFDCELKLNLHYRFKTFFWRKILSSCSLLLQWALEYNCNSTFFNNNDRKKKIYEKFILKTQTHNLNKCIMFIEKYIFIFNKKFFFFSFSIIYISKNYEIFKQTQIIWTED